MNSASLFSASCGCGGGREIAPKNVQVKPDNDKGNNALDDFSGLLNCKVRLKHARESTA